LRAIKIEKTKREIKNEKIIRRITNESKDFLNPKNPTPSNRRIKKSAVENLNDNSNTTIETIAKKTKNNITFKIHFLKTNPS